MAGILKKLFSAPVIITIVSGCFIAVAVTGLAIYWFVVPKLPSIESLRDVQLQVPLKIYTKDDKLIAEYGEKRRAPLDINQTPKTLIYAVLAAEDDRFYEHYGVDPKGLLRAVVYLIRTGQKGPGGSTITMQVARNFFLSRERTYLRKLNEILLSFKIEHELSKNEILELYLNKIYLGNRSYGFAAAAQVYYGKTLDEMTPAEIAMIAGLPKAPSAYNPIVNPERALQRRNYVLSRMRDLGSLSDEEYQIALNTPDDAELHGLRVEVEAPYVAEMVRAELYNRLGEDAYTQGYKVYTTIESRLQNAANDALRKTLLEYEERHGFRGPEANVDLSQIEANDESAYRAVLSDYRAVNKLWPALVVNVEEKAVMVYQSRHGYIKLDWDGLKWARPWNGDGKDPGDEPTKVADFLKAGDIIRIVKIKDGKDAEPDVWKLAQVPRVEGALVSLSAHDGSILALVGGFDFNKSKFNRVTQAERQPGSNIKPFNYSAALEKGYTAASLINDAPIVFEDPGLESTWRPENYSGRVFGPTRLRKALINSRNLVSIRLLRAIGIPYAINYLQKFGFRRESLPRDLSLSLGSAAITPLELVTGYAAFANGGYKVEPYFIERLETSDNVVILRANPLVVCEQCDADTNTGKSAAVEQDPALTETNLSGENPEQNIIPENTNLLISVNEDLNDPVLDVNGEVQNSTVVQRVAKRIVPPQNIYIMNSILRDVIKMGTGKRALVLNRGDIAGKTGTTNDQQDAWFSGFNPDVVATAWVGFDDPHTLGHSEYGGRAALPMWIDYMDEALKGLPEPALETPPGLVTVRIDPETGLLVGAGFPDAQFEIFRVENVPKRLDEEPVVVDLDSGETEPAKATENIPEQLF
ncbi:penicillin-binding protein 1A [Kaarinaea lacus]